MPHTIATYNIQVPDHVSDEKSPKLTKRGKQWLQNHQSINSLRQLNNESADLLQMESHNRQLQQRMKNVPVQIISPITAITWMYMCNNWRNLLDFNFQRPHNWTSASPVTRFNDTKYVSKHQIWDWHSFALLKDNILIHNGLIVKHGTEMLFVIDVEYHLPHHIKTATNAAAFRQCITTEDWKCDAVCVYREIKDYNNMFIVMQHKQYLIIEADSDLEIVHPTCLTKPLFDHDGNIFQIRDETRHVDVCNNKPFLFFILGFDKYHHTVFTGKHDWDTHGVYWWIGNMHPEYQFSRQMTMVMGQIANAINLPHIGQICYQHWQIIMQHGIPLWNGENFQQVWGMVSHQIADMQDRDKLMRRRKSGRYTRSDGMLWVGFHHGASWPDDCDNLLQVGTVAPGPYLLTLWKLLYKTLPNSNNFWQTFDGAWTKPISLTMEPQDLYNELPIASSIKSTIDINHTALFGCASDALVLEWNGLHAPNNLQLYQTRLNMRLYLNQYFDGINGCTSMLYNFKNKITVFNAFQHVWQKMIEIIICLPTIVDWRGNIGIIVALVRITGALYNCQSADELTKIQHVIKPILHAS